MITVIIPTRNKNNSNLDAILKCLESQTFKNFEIIVQVDEDSPVGKKNNVSYLRNSAIKKAKSDFIYLFDDDNLFDENFLKETLEQRNYYKNKYQKDIIITPTLIYRKTNIVQSRWYRQFNYFLSKPIPNIYKNQISMFSGNWIFWPSYIFQKNLFNENIPFVYEDLYFTYNIHRKWFPIISSDKLKINHMEREKTKLERLFIWNVSTSYQKWKNRFIFVQNHWSFVQKFLFCIFGWFIHTIWLIFNILIHWKKQNRFRLIISLLKWSFKWFVSKN